MWKSDGNTSISPTSVNNAIPRCLRRPGDEGYRTPTIDDFEGQQRQRNQHGGNGRAFPFPDQTVLSGINRSYIRADSRASSKIDANVLGESGQPLGGRPSGDSRRDERLRWRGRLKHFTWAFFTITMATGGIANVLYEVPYRFYGLTAIGDIFFLLNVVLFIVNCSLISLRFYFHPHTFKASFLHPTESLFVPAATVSFGTILINISQYGLEHVGSWLGRVVEILFWFDATLAVILSVTIYLLLWSTQYFSVSRMTPIWIFPAYPLLIIGPHAGILSTHLSASRALPIIVGGFTIQGIGFLVSLMVYSAFIYRLMTQKLPRESLRPGMFVSVGPAGFTVAGIVNMASNAEQIIPAYFMDSSDGHLIALIIKTCSQWMALWLWGLTLWFFLISVGAHLTAFVPQATTKDRGLNPEVKSSTPKNAKLSDSKTQSQRYRLKKPSMQFSMTFFSFVFPNTAMITATFAIGRAFSTTSIKILGCVMTCALIVTWVGVVIGMIRAIKNRVILWPEQGEDRDEGGFRMSDQTGRELPLEEGEVDEEEGWLRKRRRSMNRNEGRGTGGGAPGRSSHPAGNGSA